MRDLTPEQRLRRAVGLVAEHVRMSAAGAQAAPGCAEAHGIAKGAFAAGQRVAWSLTGRRLDDRAEVLAVLDEWAQGAGGEETPIRTNAVPGRPLTPMQTALIEALVFGPKTVEALAVALDRREVHLAESLRRLCERGLVRETAEGWAVT